MTIFKSILLAVALLLSLSASAADQIIRLETRDGVKVPVYYMKRDGATATVILLPGGAGGFGSPVDGKPTSNNFLVRSRDHFADAGLNGCFHGCNVFACGKLRGGGFGNCRLSFGHSSSQLLGADGCCFSNVPFAGACRSHSAHRNGAPTCCS